MLTRTGSWIQEDNQAEQGAGHAVDASPMGPIDADAIDTPTDVVDTSADPVDATIAAPDANAVVPAIGERLEMFWPAERKWYPRFVKEYDSADKHHFMCYDDGDEDWYNMLEEKWGPMRVFTLPLVGDTVLDEMPNAHVTIEPIPEMPAVRDTWLPEAELPEPDLDSKASGTTQAYLQIQLGHSNTVLSAECSCCQALPVAQVLEREAQWAADHADKHWVKLHAFMGSDIPAESAAMGRTDMSGAVHRCLVCACTSRSMHAGVPHPTVILPKYEAYWRQRPNQKGPKCQRTPNQYELLIHGDQVKSAKASQLATEAYLAEGWRCCGAACGCGPMLGHRCCNAEASMLQC